MRLEDIDGDDAVGDSSGGNALQQEEEEGPDSDRHDVRPFSCHPADDRPFHSDRFDVRPFLRHPADVRPFHPERVDVRPFPYQAREPEFPRLDPAPQHHMWPQVAGRRARGGGTIDRLS